MADFMMIMIGSASTGDWETYIGRLVDAGKLRGGSSLGRGIRMRKGKPDGKAEITGYVRLAVKDVHEARALVAGNPLYEAGGCIEILEEIPD